MGDIVQDITEQAGVPSVAVRRGRTCDLYKSRKWVLITLKQEQLNGSDASIYLSHC